MRIATRLVGIAAMIGPGTACEVTDAVGGSFASDCAIAVPLFEPYSGASDPDCSGIAVKPAEGRKKKYQSYENVWVVTTSDKTGPRSEIECTFFPHHDNCDPVGFGNGSWSIVLSGKNEAVGTSYECLCADVECVSLHTGDLIREWTWELGDCGG